MSARRVKVRGGRLVLDEPTSFPESTEIEPVVAGGDEMDEEDRAGLDDALEASWASARGGTIDAGDLLAEIERLETITERSWRERTP